MSYIVYSKSNCDSRIAARFLHIRQRKHMPLPRDYLALSGITRSTYPPGFPLNDRLQQVSGESAIDTPEFKYPTVPDMKKNHTTSRSAQSNQDDAPQCVVT